MSKDEIIDEIDKLEHKKMEYLEVNDKVNASRINRKINELNTKLDFIEMGELKKELNIYKKFIVDNELKNRFYDWRKYHEREV